VKGIGTGIALALVLAGCTSKIDWDSFRLPSIGENLRLTSMAAPVPVDVRGPVKAEDLVDSEGRCVGAPMVSAAPAVEGADPVTVPPDAALAASGIGLAMTECDVVKRAGPPEKLELGSNERSERALTLTYRKGRPGIYRFVEGRLVTIERAPEPPAPPKPVRPAKPAKPKPKAAAT
jgi:hypothetical protein